MRVCIKKADGRLIESQSGGETQAYLDTLIQNAINAGYNEADIEAKFIPDADLPALIESSKTPEQIVAEQAKADRKAAKAQAFIDNLPSWLVVETAVNNIASLADAKAFLIKLTRVVYWLAKNKAD